MFLLILSSVLSQLIQGEIQLPKTDIRSPATVRILSSRSVNVNWDIIRLHIHTPEQRFQLTLIKQTQIFHPQYQQILVGVLNDGKPIFTSSPSQPLRGHWYLAEDKSSAALYIEFNQNGQIKIEGIITEELRISAVETSTGYEHFVYYRLLPPTPNQCFSLPTKNSNLIEVDSRSIVTHVQPEVLLVLDYITSSYFQFNFEDARKYFGIFYASVNRIYDTIQLPKFINVIAGIMMTKNKSAEPFVIKNPANNLVDVGATLPAFGKWLFKQRSFIKMNYDVAIWNTGLDLGMLKNGSWSSEALGHAYIGSACHVTDDINYNVGLSEDKAGRFTGIRTHAHELAHLFGAAHDGQQVDNPIGNPGASHCPWTDGYLMSYQFGSKNSFHFSTCSVNQLQYMLRTSRGSCLLDFLQTTAPIPLNSTLPGSFLSLDEQCKSRHGQQYHFYMDYLAEVCLKLWCAKPIDEHSASITTSGPSLEGSPCALNKRCIRGDCI